jgi:hypothetical protein
MATDSALIWLPQVLRLLASRWQRVPQIQQESCDRRIHAAMRRMPVLPL